MRFVDFEHLVARHGTDTADWPEPGLAESAEVRSWLARERELDAELAKHGVEALSANFGDRLLAALPEDGRPRSARPDAERRPARWMPQAVAACLVAALIGAWALRPSIEPATEPATDEDWQSLAEEAGFEYLYDWAMTEPEDEARGGGAL